MHTPSPCWFFIPSSLNQNRRAFHLVLIPALVGCCRGFKVNNTHTSTSSTPGACAGSSFYDVAWSKILEYSNFFSVQLLGCWRPYAFLSRPARWHGIALLLSTLLLLHYQVQCTILCVVGLWPQSLNLSRMKNQHGHWVCGMSTGMMEITV